MNIKTTELLKAFRRDFGDVKSHAEIAHTRRTQSSWLKQQNVPGQSTPDLLTKPFNNNCSRTTSTDFIHDHKQCRADPNIFLHVLLTFDSKLQASFGFL